MLIREARPEDLPVVARLRLEFLAAHRGVDASSFPERLRAETAAFVQRRQDAGSIRSWLATDEGRDVGVVTMLLLDLAPRPEDSTSLEGYIVNLYVVPSARRRGTGRALVDRCLDAAERLSLRRVLLYATDDGRPLYRRAGFAPNPDWMELRLRPRGSRTLADPSPLEAPMAFTGTLLAESLQTDAVLDHLPLSVHRIRRADAGDVSAGQPLTWTFIEFEVPEAGAGILADRLSGALSTGPWYCDFRNRHETIVVFAGQVFRYARGDQHAREEAETHARSVGVPEAQLDWPE